MKTLTTNCPPLSPDAILTIRGQPMAKRVAPSRISVEEWVYCNSNTNTKEAYIFKNGKLVGYKGVNNLYD